MLNTLNFFQREDVLKFISDEKIKIVNFCHIPEEGKLKAVSFSAADHDHICDVLKYGERVDGSSLFTSIEPGKSDLYISPRISSAFIDPFAILPTLNILCDYFGQNGKPLDVSPQTVLARAEAKLNNANDIVLKALAELEFYIISPQQSELLFTNSSDNNYHEFSPFAMFGEIRNEALATLAVIGVPTKYGHGEVGRINSRDGTTMEQHEIEFMPQNLADMAETIAISKWVIRNICVRHGVSASFIPKIDLDHAGNGMHIHLCGFQGSRNVIASSSGVLSNEALCMIGGILRFAPSLSAFGNPTPVSYFRFTARKESPMHICWSAQNRLALVRIPLWSKSISTKGRKKCQETFEYRAPDAFANPYLLFAGLSLAANWGLVNSKESTKIAEDLHARSMPEEEQKFRTLPRSCNESALCLTKDRSLYETDGVFPEKLVNRIVNNLKNYKDRNMWRNVAEKPEELQKILTQYLHYG
jgi:glutamine synthetase